MRTKILEALANSLPVQQLLKSETVTQTLGSVLNLRTTVENFIEQKILSTLKVFEVPSRKEIAQMEKKIHHLESELMSMHRRALIKKLKGSVEKSKGEKNKAEKTEQEQIREELSGGERTKKVERSKAEKSKVGKKAVKKKKK
ncbi:MAG: hypothetical protein HQM15_03630 [Deltaproteobacteria bacterium]|nr:hypothetical protein [Deltaproteobacteria bacterium]